MDALYEAAGSLENRPAEIPCRQKCRGDIEVCVHVGEK